jgi:hypothetical protein
MGVGIMKRDRNLPNLPSKIKCRICENKFDNPMIQGSSIVTVVCSECRFNMLTEKTKRKMIKEKKTIELTNMKTPNSIMGWRKWVNV